VKKQIVFTVVLSIFIGSLGFVMINSGMFIVDTIEVTSNSKSVLFDENRALLAKKMEAFKGRQIWDIDVDGVASHVSNLKWVETMRVRRIFPSTLKVEVTSKEVIAAVVSDKGVVIPLSKNAETLPVLPLKHFPDVPLIRDRKILKDQKLREKALQVLTELPSSGFLSQSRVAEISSDRDEEFWISLIEDGTEIKIGSSNIPLRAARIEKVLEYLRNNKLHARVIDADFSKKVVVKLRKDR
jgi:cell division protein FtsQ